MSQRVFEAEQDLEQKVTFEKACEKRVDDATRHMQELSEGTAALRSDTDFEAQRVKLQKAAEERVRASVAYDHATEAVLAARREVEVIKKKAEEVGVKFVKYAPAATGAATGGATAGATGASGATGQLPRSSAGAGESCKGNTGKYMISYCNEVRIITI